MVYLNPREAKFKYEFQKGKPWMHENLTAPFDYSIRKSETALLQEKEQIRQQKTLFLQKSQEVADEAVQDFVSNWEQAFRKARNNQRFQSLEISETQLKREKDSLRQLGVSLLYRVFDRGILKPNEQSFFQEYGEVLITRAGLSEPTDLEALLSMREAAEFLRKQIPEDLPVEFRSLLSAQVIGQLEYNVTYDKETTENYLNARLDEVLPTRGAVQEGELIIAKGNLVDDEKYAKLNSLKQVYEGSLSGDRNYYYILIGQVLLIGILFLVLYLFLYQFQGGVMEDIGRLTFILFNLLLMVVAARAVLNIDNDYIYMVPFAVLPMVLRSFYDTRIAVFVHIIAMLVIGFLVPNSFEFIFLQIVAGVFSVLMVDNLYKRSQLFLTAGKITLVYALSYFSLAIIQEGRLENIDYWVFSYFLANGLLTLVSYPLIYIEEKLFGFVSEVSLLELSDTNNPLLRELAQKAPGTFQHSLQVANLAEAAVNAIQGNALLVRTGALYHDIGKMAAPMYFIENQSTGINPHDELSFEESASIIIGHVSNGIKMAKKQNLPDVLIDFIRTHHGTTTVMYFYKQFIKNFPEQEGALEKFTYPGPKPFSKETAILMMADTVEAASRSMNNPNHDQLDGLVERLVDQQIDSDQFENAPITLREIKAVKKIFKKMLMNIYHVRIEYPD